MPGLISDDTRTTALVLSAEAEVRATLLSGKALIALMAKSFCLLESERNKYSGFPLSSLIL